VIKKNVTNLYGLVLFGGETKLRRVLVNETIELSTAQSFSESFGNVMNSVNPSGMSDGYAALDLALDTIWRPLSYRMIIFMTTIEREIMFQNVTRFNLIRKLLDTHVILNQILNVNIVALKPQDSQTINRNPALGIVFHNQTTAYFATGEPLALESSNFEKVLGTNESSSIVYDYVFLSEVASHHEGATRSIGSVWEIQKMLDNTSGIAQVFNEAFFNNKVFEVQQIAERTVRCNYCQRDNCYFVLDSHVNRQRARDICKKAGGSLADIQNKDILNSIKNLIDRLLWINSLEGNTRDCLTAMGTTTASIDCNRPAGALCQIKRQPLIGC
jgi:hypothetical protein